LRSLGGKGAEVESAHTPAAAMPRSHRCSRSIERSAPWMRPRTDGDMLLSQWGNLRLGDGLQFGINITRQFTVGAGEAFVPTPCPRPPARISLGATMAGLSCRRALGRNCDGDAEDDMCASVARDVILCRCARSARVGWAPATWKSNAHQPTPPVDNHREIVSWQPSQHAVEAAALPSILSVRPGR
jgi:hypothetical protein